MFKMGNSESNSKYVVGNGNCVFNLYLKSNTYTVDFYRGEQLAIKVDRQKFLKKSAYFQAISKKCYELDHEKEFVEVYFPFKEKMFIKVMKFVNSDVITLDVKSVIDTHHVAEYLQIDCLVRTCLRHFTYNLNRKTVDSQLKMMEKCSFPVEKLRERAESFKRSGNVSFSGLYFLQDNRNWATCLKAKSKHSNDAVVLKEFKKFDRILSKLHRFGDALCWLQHDRVRMLVRLAQYDLVSGEVRYAVVGRAEHFVRSSVCCDSDNVYVFIEYRNTGGDHALFTLTVFHNDDGEGLKVRGEKALGMPEAKFNHVCLAFAHCHGGKLYVFYRPQETHGGPNDTFEEIRLLVLCTKSLRILKEGKLSEERSNLTEEMTRDRFGMCAFYKMFYDERQEKLFIRIFGRFIDERGRESKCGLIVFDLKVGHFHIHEKPYPVPLIYTENFKFAAGREGEVYGIRYLARGIEKFTEIRTFHLEGYELVTDEIWEVKEEPRLVPRVWSACYV